MQTKLIAHKFYTNTAHTQTNGIHTLISLLFPNDTADDIQETTSAALQFFSGAKASFPPEFTFPIELPFKTLATPKITWSNCKKWLIETMKTFTDFDNFEQRLDMFQTSNIDRSIYKLNNQIKKDIRAIVDCFIATPDDYDSRQFFLDLTGQAQGIDTMCGQEEYTDYERCIQSFRASKYDNQNQDTSNTETNIGILCDAFLNAATEFVSDTQAHKSKESSFTVRRRVENLFKSGKFNSGEHTIDLAQPKFRFMFCRRFRDCLKPHIERLQEMPGALQRGNIFCDEIQTRVSQNIDTQSSGELKIQLLSMESIYHALESLGVTPLNADPNRHQYNNGSFFVDIEVYKPLFQILTTLFTKVEDTAQPFTNIDAKATEFSAENKTHLAREVLAFIKKEIGKSNFDTALLKNWNEEYIQLYLTVLKEAHFQARQINSWNSEDSQGWYLEDSFFWCGFNVPIPNVIMTQVARNQSTYIFKQLLQIYAVGFTTPESMCLNMLNPTISSPQLMVLANAELPEENRLSNKKIANLIFTSTTDTQFSRTFLSLFINQDDKYQAAIEIVEILNEQLSPPVTTAVQNKANDFLQQGLVQLLSKLSDWQQADILLKLAPICKTTWPVNNPVTTIYETHIPNLATYLTTTELETVLENTGTEDTPQQNSPRENAANQLDRQILAISEILKDPKLERLGGFFNAYNQLQRNASREAVQARLERLEHNIPLLILNFSASQLLFFIQEITLKQNLSAFHENLGDIYTALGQNTELTDRLILDEHDNATLFKTTFAPYALPTVWLLLLFFKHVPRTTLARMFSLMTSTGALFSGQAILQKIDFLQYEMTSINYSLDNKLNLDPLNELFDHVYSQAQKFLIATLAIGLINLIFCSPSQVYKLISAMYFSLCAYFETATQTAWEIVQNLIEDETKNDDTNFSIEIDSDGNEMVEMQPLINRGN